jgi:hypothetical protein
VNRRKTMNKLTMFLLAAFAAATVAIGALAAAPSASAAAPPVTTTPEDRPCRLSTSLGLMIYPHMSEIEVIGSDHKKHKYLCYNASWIEVRTLTTPTVTCTGSLTTVLSRV